MPINPSPKYPLQIPNPPITPSLRTNVKEVSRAIASFPAGSGAGPDGFRAQHLKDLLTKKTGEAGTRLKEALVKITDLLLAGEVPSEVRPILFGATLVALTKKDGGIRPIACGCTFRRIAAKVACYSIANDVGTSLRPNQLGFGTSCGTEAAVHAARRYLDIDSPGIFLKLDFQNAFNCVHRSRILECARDSIPALYQFILQGYGSPTTLFFGESRIDSAEGLQQGDPMAPALFCLAIDSLVKNLRSILNTWYLDDGSLAGPGNLVLSDLKEVLCSVNELGLQLNPKKCELLVTGNGDSQKHFMRLKSSR